MHKQFINLVRLSSKELVALSIEKKADRPKRLAVVMQISIDTPDNARKSFSNGDKFPFTIEVNLKMFDQDFINENVSDEESFDPATSADFSFKCDCKIYIEVAFKQDETYKSSLAPQFSEELISLAYDDFRIIIEDSINRTSYRGFYLPQDFREILHSSDVLIEPDNDQ